MKKSTRTQAQNILVALNKSADAILAIGATVPESTRTLQSDLLYALRTKDEARCQALIQSAMNTQAL